MLAEFDVMIHQIIFGLAVIANLAAQAMLAKAQSLLDSGDSSGTISTTTPAKLDLTYTRPTQATKIRNYLFDAFGPYRDKVFLPHGPARRDQLRAKYSRQWGTHDP